MPELLGRILFSGLVGALTSGIAACIASRFNNGHAARPMNAVAHIYDGGAPPAHNGDAARNTLLGSAIHTGASLWWAAFYQAALAVRPHRLPAAAAIAALAYVVDYHVVHKRFRPGFEAYLTARGMFAVYAALAAGYAVSGGDGRALVRKRKYEGERASLARTAREAQLAAQEPRQLTADR